MPRRMTIIFIIIMLLVLLVGSGVYFAYESRTDTSVEEIIQTNNATTSVAMPMTQDTPFTLASTAFVNNGTIPAVYSCDAEGKNPPLTFAGTPATARSLVLIVTDHDVPKALKPDGLFVHWVLFNIPPAVTELPAGASAGTQGANSAGKDTYYPPCPPPQYEPSTHRYVFTLYALDTTLTLPHGATRDEVLAAMQGHVVAETALTGTYTRAK